MTPAEKLAAVERLECGKPVSAPTLNTQKEQNENGSVGHSIDSGGVVDRGLHRECIAREKLAHILLETSPPDWQYDEIIRLAAEALLSAPTPAEPDWRDPEHPPE